MRLDPPYFALVIASDAKQSHSLSVEKFEIATSPVELLAMTSSPMAQLHHQYDQRQNKRHDVSDDHRPGA